MTTNSVSPFVFFLKTSEGADFVCSVFTKGKCYESLSRRFGIAESQ